MKTLNFKTTSGAARNRRFSAIVVMPAEVRFCKAKKEHAAIKQQAAVCAKAPKSPQNLLAFLVLFGQCKKYRNKTLLLLLHHRQIINYLKHHFRFQVQNRRQFTVAYQLVLLLPVLCPNLAHQVAAHAGLLPVRASMSLVHTNTFGFHSSCFKVPKEKDGYTITAPREAPKQGSN